MMGLFLSLYSKAMIMATLTDKLAAVKAASAPASTPTPHKVETPSVATGPTTSTDMNPHKAAMDTTATSEGKKVPLSYSSTPPTSSDPSTLPTSLPANPDEPKATEEKLQEAAEKEAAKFKDKVYTADKLQRFVNSKGTMILPVDGVFIPRTQEEFDTLEHFADANMDYVQRK